MRIPTDAGQRDEFYKNLMHECLISREPRRRKYAELKRYYMYGCGMGGNPGETVNKIYPHIDQLSSFMYSQETTKFAVSLDSSVSDGELAKIPTINRAVNDMWHASNSDIIFGNALIWSFVYGSMFVKTRWNGQSIEPFSVEPHNFGVLREDTPMLSRQEAFIQCYMSTRSELERELRLVNHPRVDDIIKRVSTSGHPDSLQGIQAGNVVVSSVTPQIIGNVDINLSAMGEYNPKVAAGLIKMYELYVQNDKHGEYQIVTIADPDIIIYDRPLTEMFVEGEQPFVQICPSPAHDYFWGFSEIERLLPLQDMRNERLIDIRKMMKMQARPSKTFTGFPGVTDEMNANFDQPDGYMQSDMPGAKVDPYQPVIPEDLFMELRELDAMFEEMSGINNVLSGRGEQGVRSAGHASQLAKLGSSRAKKRALIIEDALEKAATLDLQLEQKYSTRRYKDDDGTQFILDQFTKDFVVKVDAHSNSPIFMEENDAKMFELFKARAIDREELLDLVEVPMRELLKQRLKTKIEPAEVHAAEQENVLRLKGASAKKG